MKFVLAVMTLFFSFSTFAAFLPYMKVECRDVEGLFAVKDTVLVFELQETKTGNLQYTEIDSEKNGRIGFTGHYYTSFYKLKPNGNWGDVSNEGRLKLISNSNQAEILFPNCKVLDR
jgi:hypothetical protein